MKKASLCVAVVILCCGFALGQATEKVLYSFAGSPLSTRSLSFATITQWSPVLYPNSLAAGDLIHDGRAALGVVGEETTGLFVNLSPAEVYSQPDWTVGPGGADAPFYIIFADVYQDGNLDAVSTDADEPIVATAPSNGHGGFDTGQDLSTGSCGDSTQQVAVGDLNGDGIPDIVASVYSSVGPGCLAIFMGEGGGKFANAEDISSGGTEPLSVAIGDLNNDGIPDLVVANFGSPFQGDFGNVSVLLGKGDGTFAPPVKYVGLIEPTRVTLADFNGDGKLDVAVSLEASNQVYRALGRGDGTFSPVKSYPAGQVAISVISADFNGDGIPDLAVANYVNPKPCSVSVLLGRGDGTFRKPVQFPVGASPAQVVAADFNGDGKPDIATFGGSESSSTVTILLNTTPWPNEKKE